MSANDGNPYRVEGTEVFLHDTKIGFINGKGKLQMLAGQAQHRGAVLELLAETKDAVVAPPGADNTPVPYPQHIGDPTDTVPAAGSLPAGIPPCPVGDPGAGDKDPAVIRWWVTHHPEQAKERYKGRKFQVPEGIVMPA